MPTKYHQHIRIKNLLSLSDKELAELIQHHQGPQAVREGLQAMQKRGIHFLTVEECDNQNPDGSCAGHDISL